MPEGASPDGTAAPSGAESAPASARTLTWALVAWLPLAKWGLPAAGLPPLLVTALFYGGGVALSLLAVWRAGDWPALRPLFATPLAGLLLAVGGFGLLLAAAFVLLFFPPLSALLPGLLLDLVQVFDPLPLWLAFQEGSSWFPPGALLWSAGLAAGAVAEEWIFRVVLFWRWAMPREGEAPRRVGWKLLAVSLYFAALHWPDHQQVLTTALLGSIVLGLVLWRRPNFTLVAALHVLFNWKTALF